MENTRKQELKNNLEKVLRELAAHCAAAGREPKAVTLLPVSKKHPISDILLLREEGDYAFGENYVQELNEKFADLPTPAAWHMIGHLQRNKVKQVVGKVTLIHSVDSLPLAAEIEKQAAKQDIIQDILLEVNVAGEESKWGFPPEAAESAAREISGTCPHLRLRGLMTSAPITENPESNRPYFRALRELLGTLQAENLPHTLLDTLSMGMSLDYAVAIEEGATIIRVGTAIFGERDYSH